MTLGQVKSLPCTEALSLKHIGRVLPPDDSPLNPARRPEARSIPLSDVKEENMVEHRWSGWPGAWCLDCGCDDPREIALAEGRFDADDEGNTHVSVTAEQMTCAEPGSGRHDPYERRRQLPPPDRR